VLDFAFFVERCATRCRTFAPDDYSFLKISYLPQVGFAPVGAQLISLGYMFILFCSFKK